MNHFKSAIKAAVRISRMIVVVCLIVLTSSLPLPNRVQAAAGDLDPTFGISGKVTTDFLTNQDEAQAIMIQSDGKIMAAGTNGVDFALARYNSDGSPDLTFAANGKTTTDFFGVSEDQAFALAIQPDGKIIAAGRARSNINISLPLGFAMARYNSDGSPDSSFGSGGEVYTQILGQQDEARAITIQSDGKIILAGSAFNNSSSNFEIALARYNSDGSPDSMFGTGGTLTMDLSGGNGAFAVTTQTDGKIIVAGDAFSPVTGFDFALLRFNNDGSLDATFGNNGLTTTDFSNNPSDEAFAMALQQDGKIIVAGVAGDSGLFFRDFALARYSPNGILDSTFGNNGRVTTDFFGDIDIANGVAVQADGKIVASGSTHSFTPNSDFAVARYNSNGSPDSFFGMGGRVAVDFSGHLDKASEAAIQSDGKIVVAGNATNNAGTDSDFALVRFEANGVFNICLQDDSNGNILQINTTTGEYQFANCGGFAISGAGTLTRKGCVITLQHNAADRRVLVRIDTCQKKATASVQIFSQGTTFTITDRNTTNNTCACGN